MLWVTRLLPRRLHRRVAVGALVAGLFIGAVAAWFVVVQPDAVYTRLVHHGAMTSGTVDRPGQHGVYFTFTVNDRGYHSFDEPLEPNSGEYPNPGSHVVVTYDVRDPRVNCLCKPSLLVSRDGIFFAFVWLVAGAGSAAAITAAVVSRTP